ncbi:hypothetical protein ACFO4N_14955 [Camelliibacillus cellulosilyticus]|uniref:Glucosamine inositolphosphorylceramide transferase 1 N-terminal domain-containing protein n=1 Tax=Camelliibacillus cellulosilyticus TaxID=2174486 RepID=A0ABV9GRX6_9BACL
MLNKKVVRAIWSIKAFKSTHILSAQPSGKQLDQPSLQAGDVTDVPAEFVADPFVVSHRSSFFMFFEVYNKRSGRGEIGLATSQDGESWHYKRIVLKEDFHLSYPHVFQVNHQFYMIPETANAGGIFLYQATQFPFVWERAAKLLDGSYVDPSIFYYRDKWWLFAGAKNNSLRLFSARHFKDHWVEHPKSPIIVDDGQISRPAGRVIMHEGVLYRFTQNRFPYYGRMVRAFKIHHLTESAYQEEVVDVVLNGSNQDDDWHKDGMHHVDHLKISDREWLIAVDGHVFEHQSYLLNLVKRLVRDPYLLINKIKKYL